MFVLVDDFSKSTYFLKPSSMHLRSSRNGSSPKGRLGSSSSHRHRGLAHLQELSNNIAAPMVFVGSQLHHTLHGRMEL